MSNSENAGSKRKRLDTAGNAEVSSQIKSQNPPAGSTVPAAPAAKGKSSSGSPSVPKEWSVQLCAVQPLPVTPPDSVVAEFVRLYNGSLSGYKRACEDHSKRAAGRERFNEVMQREETPSVILNTLKGPTFAFVSSEAESEAKASEAFLEYSSALIAVRKAATVYQLACFNTQVNHSRALVDSRERMEACTADLTQYASKVLSEFGAVDLNRWKPYIEAVVRALDLQLEATRLEVVGAFIAAKEDAARRAADLAAAQSEAEVKMDTQSVEDLIDEKLKKLKAEISTSDFTSFSSSRPHPTHLSSLRPAETCIVLSGQGQR